MTPLAVFVRTLLKTTAIFLGTAMVFLNPPMEWSAGRSVTAQKSATENAVDGLLAALKDPDTDVRAQAAWALGQMRARRALPALLNAMSDEADVRRSVVRALGEIQDPATVTVLTAALQDPDAKVRRYAARALARFKK